MQLEQITIRQVTSLYYELAATDFTKLRHSYSPQQRQLLLKTMAALELTFVTYEMLYKNEQDEQKKQWYGYMVENLRYNYLKGSRVLRSFVKKEFGDEAGEQVFNDLLQTGSDALGKGWGNPIREYKWEVRPDWHYRLKMAALISLAVAMLIISLLVLIRVV